MINDFELLWGIAAGSHSSWLEVKAASPQAGGLGAPVLLYPSHIPHIGRTSIMLRHHHPDPQSHTQDLSHAQKHHVKGAHRVPSLLEIWQLLIIILLIEIPLSPHLVMVRASNMDALDWASSEGWGRENWTQETPSEFPEISRISRELRLGHVSAVLVPGQCLKTPYLDFYICGCDCNSPALKM